MDNKEENKGEVSAQVQAEPEKKVVKKIVKKTGDTAPKESQTKQDNSQPANRNRAVTTINSSKTAAFEKKPPGSSNAVAGRKEAKPVQTIGQEGFKSRLSIFDRAQQFNNSTTTSKEDPGPKKLDPSKFGGFENPSTTNNQSGGSNAPVGISGGIQAKMNAYLENARVRSKTCAHVDPVLLTMKDKKNVDNDEEEQNIENAEKSEDELAISGDEEEKQEKEEELVEEDVKKAEDKVELKEEDEKIEAEVKNEENLEKTESNEVIEQEVKKDA